MRASSVPGQPPPPARSFEDFPVDSAGGFAQKAMKSGWSSPSVGMEERAEGKKVYTQKTMYLFL